MHQGVAPSLSSGRLAVPFNGQEMAALALVGSSLALAAPVGAAAPQPIPQDWGAAAPAGLARAPVDARLAAIVAIGACEIPEITERGAASADAGLQDLHQGGPQALKGLRVEAPCGGVGVDAGRKQRLIGIDIADSGHQGLIEQGALDRSAGAPQPLLKMGCIESWIEGFRSQPGQAGDHLLNRSVGWNPPHLGEAAGVDEAQFIAAAAPEANPGVGTRLR